MSFISQWFRKGRTIDEPDIGWGRFSDAYKAPGQYRAWDAAQLCFEEGRVWAGVIHLADFLKDARQNNVTLVEEERTLHLLQGSAHVTLNVGTEYIVVKTALVRGDAWETPMLRHLLEENYALKYCRYALDGDMVVIIFDSFHHDISAYKLYYALKELSIKADKKDDLFLEKWDGLFSVDNDHLSDFSRDEVERRARLLIDEGQNVLDLAVDTQWDWNRYKHGLTYCILDSVFKMDYLITPQGKWMETVDNIYQLYFSDDQGDREMQNEEALNLLRSALARPMKEVQKELYRVTSTFGVQEAVNVGVIAEVVSAEKDNLNWYIRNGHTLIAQKMIGFVIGYCLYRYAPPHFIKRLMELYYRACHPLFFQVYGYRSLVKGRQLDIRYIQNLVHQYAQEEVDMKEVKILDLATYPNNLVGLGTWILDNILMIKGQWNGSDQGSA